MAKKKKEVNFLKSFCTLPNQVMHLTGTHISHRGLWQFSMISSIRRIRLHVSYAALYLKITLEITLRRMSAVDSIWIYWERSVPHRLLPHQLLPHRLLPHQLLPHQLLPHQLLRCYTCARICDKRMCHTVHGRPVR